MHISSFIGLLADSTATPSAAASPAGTPGTPTSPLQVLFGSPLTLIVLMIVMMYFLIFRPQSQRAKQQAKLLEALKAGDKVVTASGIIGVVVTVKEKTVSIRSADAKMEMTKSSVTEILERGSDSTPA
jgi:preprotein translocase subunit YajC